MPTPPNSPPVRVRLREGGVYSELESAGERWRAKISHDLAPHGGQTIDASGQWASDGFDARVSGGLDASGARASGELRTTRGPLAGAVHAQVRADGLQGGVDAEMHLGASRAGVSVSSDAGQVAVDLDAGVSLADTAELSVQAARDIDASTLRAALSVRVGSAPVVSMGGGRRVQERRVIEPDDTELGRIRAQELRVRPGAQFVLERVTTDADAGAQKSVPASVVDLRVAASARRQNDVQWIRLCDPSCDATEARPSPDAHGVAQLRAGESLAVMGLAGTQISASSSLAARLPFGAGFSLGSSSLKERQASFGVDVARLDAQSALVTLTRTHVTSSTRAREVDGGLGLRLPTLPAVRNPIVHVAADTLHAAGTELLDSLSPLGADDTQEASTRTEELCALRVDLSRADVLRGLEAALRGDWQALELLEARGVVERVSARSLDASSQSHEQSVHLLGLSRGSTSSQERTRSTEVSSSRIQREDEQAWGRTVRWGGWLGSGSEQLTHRERDVSTIHRGSRALPDTEHAVRSVEGTLGWRSERSVNTLRPQQLEVALRTAALLGDSDVRADVEAYQARLRAHQTAKGRLPDAKLEFAVLIDDDGIARAREQSIEGLWEHAALAWAATHPEDATPLWTRPAGRRSLEEYGPLRHGHADYAPYHEVRELLEALQGSAPKHEVLRRVRTLLEQRSHDVFWIVCLAKIVGLDHVGVVLEVDASGADHALDFSLSP